MAEKCMGVVVSGDAVKIVVAEVPKVGPIEILADDTWQLQTGDRSQAYGVVQKRIRELSKQQGIEKAVVKASALSTGGTKLAHLLSAELRGVVLASLCDVPSVKQSKKASISRTFGDRKVDEYLKDDEYWSKNTKRGTP